MVRALILSFVTVLFATVAGAQVAIEDMSREQAEAELNLIMTPDLAVMSEPLNKHVDYIVRNYPEQELKALIKNYEMTTRRVAITEGQEYIPYDRRIDVNNHKQVKRFLQNRIDTIF